MADRSRTIFVFILPKRGCVAYSLEMIRHLTGLRYKVYVSRRTEGELPDQSVRIPTFRNGLEFCLATLFVLPFWLVKIGLAAPKNDCKAFYFPVLHHWTPFLLLLARLLKIPGIITVHDAVTHPGEPGFLQGYFQKVSIRLASGVVTLSEYVDHQLPADGKPRRLIPHGILALPGLIRKNSPAQRPVRLLFLGRVARYKGIDLLWAALQQLDEALWAGLTIAGDIVDPDFERFHHPKVKWRNEWLAEEEISRLLNEADVLVLPYREASQSGIITLGIAAAIPMVVTRVGGLSEQLGPDEAVWVTPEAESLAEGIKILAENVDLYHRIQAKLAAYTSHATGWKEHAARLEQFIDALKI